MEKAATNMAKDEQSKDEQKKRRSPAEGDKHAAEEPKAGRKLRGMRPRNGRGCATRFEKEVAPALMKELDLKNPMAVPRLNKIVVNMGVGEATQNAKIIDPAVNELGQITGQKPV